VRFFYFHTLLQDMKRGTGGENPHPCNISKGAAPKIPSKYAQSFPLASADSFARLKFPVNLIRHHRA
jgi:hypothetical protein